MITPLSFKDQTIFILGLGRSGLSVSHSLLKAGGHVLAWDDKHEARQLAREQGIPLANIHSLNWHNIHHLVLSPGIPHHYPVPHPLISKALNAGLQPISDLEILYHSNPQARYVGVTGSNGKSTTTALLGHILKECGKSVEVGGNIGIPVMHLNPLTKDGTYVLEVSSYQLETSPNLHFNISILLNITPDHLDRHGGMEGYIEAKKLIYKNSTPNDTLIIGVDDEPCTKIYESLKDSGSVGLIPISVTKVLSHGIYVSEEILYENRNPVMDLKQFDRLRGGHNWQNIAAAYGALRSMNVDPEHIREGIASFPGLAHRQQVVATHENVLFVNDSKATNVEAVAKAFEAYQDFPIYWLLGGQPKEGGITSLKPYFSNVKHAFLFGEATSDFSLTLEGKVPYTVCNTLGEAVKRASSLAFNNAEEKTVVLLSPACASFDQFKDFEARGEVFCEVVKRVIGERE
jgi:UDP-N-acetylmuramoylalanine--D-glutamate ligase